MPRIANKILRLGIGLSCLSQILGCAADSFHNVVQSAHVTAGDPPVVTNANLREDWGTTAIGLSGSYSGRHRLKTTSDTDGDQYDSYAAVPNNYEIDWNRQDFALSLRHTPNRIWDLFLDYNASFQLPYWSNVSTAGVGLTLPFPWLSIRVSPALSMASYRRDVTDSVYQRIAFPFTDPRDTAYVTRSAGIESEFFWTLGFTLWPSPTLIDWPFIPYVGYQNSERLSESFDESVQLLEYSDSRWLAGFYYNPKNSWKLNLSVSRVEKYNPQRGDAYYEIGVGMEYRLNSPRKPSLESNVESEDPSDEDGN